MENPEKLETQEHKTKKKIKHNTTQYVLDTTMREQTTGGNDESDIGLMWKSYQRSQHGTQNVKTHNRTTQKL